MEWAENVLSGIQVEEVEWYIGRFGWMKVDLKLHHVISRGHRYYRGIWV
ncbi:unnamed protein product [Meloidogyne enterolobii]|uniref:Uncharacterized protein n=1 Tax=Meloidogyne enterolobii TaxID=390850 RepID=A0ACB0YGL0_MELEN